MLAFVIYALLSLAPPKFALPYTVDPPEAPASPEFLRPAGLRP